MIKFDKETNTIHTESGKVTVHAGSVPLNHKAVSIVITTAQTGAVLPISELDDIIEALQLAKELIQP